MYTVRPYLLAETNWKNVKETDYQLAVLPWGATEAHNYHLPYATDNYQVDYVAAESARLAWEAGTKLTVLPCIPFGINSGQLDIKLCMNLNPSTQLAILKDVVDVLDRHHINKLVILNGHGGNNFKVMIRELSVCYPQVFVCSADWYKAIRPWTDYFEDDGDHAGELETSVMMHIAPKLVRPLAEAGDGSSLSYTISGFTEGWVTGQRQWTKISKDTGVGNPAMASAEKGEHYLQLVCQKIADFYVQLANTPLEDMWK